ncbi:XrtA system polysaccharide deacetylase [Dyella sp. A6]|uniref:XrtA system polysaccharide deacetylase n=1 Tax=Dyella aluminiiresistens TaxID=3069105 RepID=UPI002E797AB5|nr:XrtA system polysaccharide deacetylase [Dyella sp. A6]
MSSPGTVTNAMTVDVEDYFQVAAFEKSIRREDWQRWPLRVEDNTRRVLELFERRRVKATFFVLGWVAERCPSLVRDIGAAGHEIASHGFGHERLTTISPAEFRDGIIRTKHLLEDLGGVPVTGYRAPSYSIGPGTLWAYDQLQEAGYRYSSSIVPIRHDLYGMPSAPRFPFRVARSGVLEVPVTTARMWGRNWPCGGGGYFRLLPYELFKRGLRRVNHQERRPGVFYFHPWEVDPGQPRVPGVTRKNQVRHYLNLDRMAARVERLVQDFQFDRMDRVFPAPEHADYPVVELQADDFRERQRSGVHA